jgi:hypothetical protein
LRPMTDGEARSFFVERPSEGQFWVEMPKAGIPTAAAGSLSAPIGSMVRKRDAVFGAGSALSHRRLSRIRHRRLGSRRHKTLIKPPREEGWREIEPTPPGSRRFR